LLWRIGCVSLVCLLACSSNEPSGVRPALTREQLLDPTNCKDCHPKQYAEWSSSMHAYATKDPVFQAMNKRGQTETGGTLGPFCVNCHAPMAVRENMISDYSNVANIPSQLQGVTCYFCHNATGVGTDHFNANITLGDDTIMRGGINGAQIPSTHKVQHSSNLDHDSPDSSVLCGTCHDIVNQSGFALERTFTEYQQTFFGNPSQPLLFKSCGSASCHMDKADNQELVAQSSGYPGVSTHVRDVHEHLFPGVDVALTDFPNSEAMRLAVEQCKLPTSISYFTVDPNPPGARFTVNIETQAGHAEPSGASQDRRLWLEVVGTDDNGKVLYTSPHVEDGELEETAEKPQPCMMRDYTLDASGNEAHMFWDAASLDPKSNPIPLPKTPQAGSHTRTCPFPAPGLSVIPHLQFTLRMRPIGMDVLQDLVSSGHLSTDVVAKMPTLTVQTRSVNFSTTTNQYQVDDAPQGDCRTYKCMLDPNGQDCSGVGAAGSGSAAAGQAGVGAAASAGAASAPPSAASGGASAAGVGGAGTTTVSGAGVGSSAAGSGGASAGAASTPVAGGPARD
jgi:hypothetical protein